MKQRQQSSTSYPVTFLMVDSSDHITGKTGLTPTVTVSKNGSAFGSPSGAVSEIGSGWYALAGNATDRATLGDLLIHATATGADPVDDRYCIVPWDPFNATSLGLSNLDAAVSTRSTYAGGDTSGVTTLLARIIGTLATGTHTPQTGDAFARLGAPAGASVSADVAAIKTDTGTTIPGRLPTALTAGGNIKADILAISGDTGAADGAESFFDGSGYIGLSNIIGTVMSVAGDVQGNVDGTVGGVTAPVTAGTVSDKTGYALTSAYDAAKTAATQTSVDDVPTNSELATALGTADDAVIAAIAALNNLSSAQVQSAATAALNAYDPPTNAEMEARTLVAASYFDPAADTVARVTLTDTVTTLTNMPAAAPTAAANADAVWDELLVGHAGVGSAGAALTAASAGGDPSVLADAVWDEALSGHVIVGSAGAGLAAAGSAGDPWSTTLPGAYTGNQAGAILDGIRDVTDAIDTSAVIVAASNDAGVLTVIQAVTFNVTVSGLTISATWAKLYWTLKESIYDDDDQAILQLVESNPGAGTDGLLYLDSAEIVLPITVADGTLTVNQAAGTVVIAVTDNATALLSAASELVWDIKTKDAAGATVQNTTGTASITRAITQTI